MRCSVLCPEEWGVRHESYTPCSGVWRIRYEILRIMCLIVRYEMCALCSEVLWARRIIVLLYVLGVWGLIRLMHGCIPRMRSIRSEWVYEAWVSGCGLVQWMKYKWVGGVRLCVWGIGERMICAWVDEASVASIKTVLRYSAPSFVWGERG